MMTMNPYNFFLLFVLGVFQLVVVGRILDPAEKRGSTGVRPGRPRRCVLRLALAGLRARRAGCSAPPQHRDRRGQDAAASPAPSSGQQQALQRSGLLHPGSGKFFGIEADGAPDSLGPVSTFAANTGRKPNLIGQYVAWGTPFDAPPRPMPGPTARCTTWPGSRSA